MSGRAPYLLIALIEKISRLRDDAALAFNAAYRATVESQDERFFTLRVLTEDSTGALVEHPLFDAPIKIPLAERPHDIRSIETGALVRVRFYEGDPGQGYIEAVMSGRVERSYRGLLDTSEGNRPAMQLVAGKGHAVRVTLDGEALRAYLAAGKLIAGVNPVTDAAGPPWDDIEIDGEITEGFPSFDHEEEAG